jgi:hypothetical protein
VKVLMVLTSHDQLGNTWRKTGFWLEELAAPYYVFKEAGAEITLGSPKGGVPRSIPRVTNPNSEPTLRAGSDADAQIVASGSPLSASPTKRSRHFSPITARLRQLPPQIPVPVFCRRAHL